jgi:hypothetical protein
VEAATANQGRVSGGVSLSQDNRGTKVITKTIYKNLRQAGLDERDVIAVATELLAQATAELRG